jgi:hypothetical protein
MVSLNEEVLQEKVLAGERISAAEASDLFRWPLADLGVLADARRNLAKEKDYDHRGREIVTYIVDRNINYTNVCNVYCKFCAFYRTEKDADHYVLSQEEFDQKLDELTAAGGVQILMQGGHHPKLGFDWYLDLLHHIREKYPHINIHGFSPPEFQHFAETFGMPLREVISRFKEAGLGSIPGGGGEILVDSVRQRIAPLKCKSDQWLEVMQAGARARIEIERDDDVRACRDDRRPSRTSAALTRSTRRDWWIHSVHLLDVPTRKHSVKGVAPDRFRGISADAGGGPHFPRQLREHSEFMGDAGAADRPDRAQVWGERFRVGHDGGKCSKQCRNDFSTQRPDDRGADS